MHWRLWLCHFCLPFLTAASFSSALAGASPSGLSHLQHGSSAHFSPCPGVSHLWAALSLSQSASFTHLHFFFHSPFVYSLPSQRLRSLKCAHTAVLELSVTWPLAAPVKTVPAMPCTFLLPVLITTGLFDHLGSWLNLATIPCSGTVGWGHFLLAGLCPALLLCSLFHHRDFLVWGLVVQLQCGQVRATSCWLLRKGLLSVLGACCHLSFQPITPTKTTSQTP